MIVQQEKQFGSESCHAYDRNGNPRHQVPYKDKKRGGELRNTTIKDIRENSWLPSVSSILGVMAKKGLDGWIKRETAKGTYELTTSMRQADALGGTSFEDFIEKCIENSEIRMAKARDLGTEIHGAIESYLSVIEAADWEPAHPGIPHWQAVNAAGAALKDLGVWGQPFSSERTFAANSGFGGTVDISSTKSVSEQEWVWDFKCVDRLDKKLTYPDRAAQLCAYSVGLFGEYGPQRLGNIFISTSEPGEYLIHEWSAEEKEHGWALFQACFQLWKVVNRYDPALKTQALQDVSFSKIV